MENLLEYSETIHNTLPLLWQKITIALLIGLLVGIERERNKKEGEKSFAGVRTFPFIALFGFLAAVISSLTSTSIYIALFIVFGLLVCVSYYFSAQKGELGGTSEISMLLVFLLGSLVFWGFLLLSGAVTIVIVAFLTFKPYLHKFTDVIDQEDIYATIKLAIITVIILPLLPEKGYGPYEIFQPQKIWYMVVLIAGVSFVGYVLFKIIGAKRGVQVLSILGGLASSTALTLSFTQRSKEAAKLSKNFSAGILLASSIMFPRVLIIIYILNSKLATSLILPFTIFTAVGIITSLFLWRGNQMHEIEKIELKNPFKLLFAIKFGLIFALILFISKIANVYFGDQGIYVTSLLSGLADVDAIALSITDLQSNELSLTVASNAIVIAAISNSVAKGIIASIFGSKELRKFSALGFGIMLVAGIIILAII